MPDHHRSDILFAFGVALLLVLAWYARDVLLLIYISALFAVVINPAIAAVRKFRLGKWRPGRGLAIFLIILFGLALLTVFLVFAIPPIYNDLQSFGSDLPAKAGRLRDRLQGLPFASKINPERLQEYIAGAIGGVFGLFKGVAGGVAMFFSWLILTAYFIVDGERAFRWSMSLFSPQHRPKLEATLLKAEARVSKWLIGQFSLMLILGSLSTIVFELLGVKYFYALGVFCGLANIVPIVGPVVSVGTAAVVAAIDSWGKALGVLVFYLIYQQLENAFLTPRIMKTTVDLPPLAVIIALALGGSILGVLGALVAVPTAALIAVLLDEYVVQRPKTA